MRPRRRSALLWGLVGALVFLVGVQTLRLLTDATVTLPVALGVAALVGLAAGVVSRLLERRVGPAFVAVEPDDESRPGGKEQS